MTTRSTAEEKSRRAHRRAQTLGEDLALSFETFLLTSGLSRAFAWPSEQWAHDPVGFFRTVLGFEPWEKQIEIAEAVRDHDRVAVRSNNKAGKTTLLAAIALWYLSSHEGARVILTAETSRQVEGALYREVKMLHAGAGRCVDCKRLDRERLKRGQAPGPRPCPHSHILDGEPGELPHTGIKLDDFRELVGFTSKQAEAVAGVSGSRLLYIFDEASGRSLDKIYQAILGNLSAGAGAKFVLLSNPTRTIGEFFDAFHSKSESWHKIHISAFDSPNVKAGRIVIHGLASQHFIDESRKEFGERSPFYMVRVLGEFPIAEAGAVFTFEAIEHSMASWETATTEGGLTIGVDVAGDSGRGDESAFAVRRGQKIVSLHARHGVSPAGHLVEVLGLIGAHRQRIDEIRVVIDVEGEPGARVWEVFRAWKLAQPENAPLPFEPIGVRASFRAERQVLTYERVRDELIASLADWIRGGGALPPDRKLAAELNAFRWVQIASGRNKLAPKETIRELLGHSPDRADAVALACWRDRMAPATAEVEGPAPAMIDPHEAPADRTFDPYSSVGAIR
jgi:phage terminase large subunit